MVTNTSFSAQGEWLTEEHDVPPWSDSGRRQTAYAIVVSSIITWLLAQTTQNSGRGLYIETEGTSTLNGVGVLELAFGDVWYCTC